VRPRRLDVVQGEHREQPREDAHIQARKRK
jgi:hypothetical protein